MESSPYDEAYNIDDEDEPSQVDMYTPSPRNPKQNIRQENGQRGQISFYLRFELVTYSLGRVTWNYFRVRVI